MVYMIMGVSGSGKTTLGELLAARLDAPYQDADSFHPEENIRKMSIGTALSDADRLPWLENIRQEVLWTQGAGETAVFSCSALKESYRRILSEGLDRELCWIYLKGDFDTILDRMKQRKGHFFKENMLKSQFALLEEPVGALVVDITLSPEEKVDTILRNFTRK